MAVSNFYSVGTKIRVKISDIQIGKNVFTKKIKNKKAFSKAKISAQRQV